MKARLKGAEVHYEGIHTWGEVSPKEQIKIEYHLGSLFFNMDSAIECLIFALNSLGFAVEPSSFIDIANENAIKGIKPVNIMGKKNQIPGYDEYFPHTKEYMLEHKDLLEIIIEQHDVSKHRQAIFQGGICRFDPPEDFFKKRGIEDNAENRVLHAPFAEIMLMREPKMPESKRKSMSYREHDKLEDIGPRFCTFMNELGYKAKNDAQVRITPEL